MDTVYELMLLLKPSGDESTREGRIKKIEEIIDSSKGKVKSKKLLGKKELAYPIKKEKEAYFYLLELEGSGAFVQNLSRKIQLQDSVLRHLVVRKEE